MQWMPRQEEDMLQFTPSCPEDDGEGLEEEQQGEPSSQIGLCSRKGAREGGLCPTLGGNSVSGCSGPTEPTRPLPSTPGLLGKAEKTQKLSFTSQLQFPQAWLPGFETAGQPGPQAPRGDPQDRRGRCGRQPGSTQVQRAGQLEHLRALARPGGTVT